MVAVGSGEEARKLYTQSLDIARRLAETEPDRADHQRDLSISYERLGLIAADSGDNATAVTYLKKGLAITDGLLALEPENAMLARERGIKLIQLAQVIDDPGPTLREAQQQLEALETTGTLDDSGRRALDSIRANPAPNT